MGIHTKLRNDTHEWFSSFARSFQRNDIGFMRSINLKIDHTERVILEARDIARSLKCSESWSDLAQIAARLHDIGRFVQLEKYHTFSDRDSINHAELSRDIVREQRILQQLSPESRETVLDAIAYHNAPTIPEDLPKNSKQLLSILRDADKIDIWRILAQEYSKPSSQAHHHTRLNLPIGETVAPEIWDYLQNRKPVKLKELTNLTELKLLQLSWLYDINHLWTHLQISRRGYMKTIINTLPQNIKKHPAVKLLFTHSEEMVQEARKAGHKGR